ncbi:TRAP transporter large permease [Haloarcula nitratireducens]|uniref:TRAP transporter large permease n=1 Tax=Haloarcula nitratireducens TaxID=2487749 RepID=A0AAW4PI95_9EURY|nr:TRAP transporter large permease [Halomicroarcula nitratireducens]MBX0297472.1 TRAP transporter large permease [Halomicroarcula nitratireducens]
MVSATIIGILVLTAILILLGIPVFASLGIGGYLLLQVTNVLPTVLLGQTLFTGLDAFALIAVPLFILTGDAIVETGFSRKLLNFTQSIFGGFRTGMGTATLFGCGLFAAISGSNASDAAALGRITLDRLEERGYSRSYASSIVASGASTGILIPPSISYIIVGLVFGISASTLFLAALIPGVAILLGMVVMNVVMNRVHGYESGTGHPELGDIGYSVWDAKYGLLIPFIILGGIYSGVFTPTEASAVAVITTIVIGVVLQRLSLPQFPEMLERSALVNGVIAPIIAIALLFSQALSALGIPEALVSAVIGTTTNFYLVTLIMIVILFMAGAIMETTPNILVLGPILLPIGERIGMHPVHFSVFFISALAVGFITPPIGLNLYVMSGVSGESITDIARDAVPFMLAMLAIILLIAWFPVLSMWGI